MKVRYAEMIRVLWRLLSCSPCFFPHSGQGSAPRQVMHSLTYATARCLSLTVEVPHAISVHENKSQSGTVIEAAACNGKDVTGLVEYIRWDYISYLDSFLSYHELNPRNHHVQSIHPQIPRT